MRIKVEIFYSVRLEDSVLVIMINIYSQFSMRVKVSVGLAKLEYLISNYE